MALWAIVNEATGVAEQTAESKATAQKVCKWLNEPGPQGPNMHLGQVVKFHVAPIEEVLQPHEIERYKEQLAREGRPPGEE